MTWQSALGHKAIGAASLCDRGRTHDWLRDVAVAQVRPRSQSRIGAASQLSDRGRTPHMTGYVTWQSALGQKATGETEGPISDRLVAHFRNYAYWELGVFIAISLENPKRGGRC